MEYAAAITYLSHPTRNLLACFTIRQALLQYETSIAATIHILPIVECY